MTISRIKELISFGDRIFFLATIGQSIVFTLILISGVIAYLTKSKIDSNTTIKSVFQKWEPEITESIFINEAIGIYKSNKPKVISNFEDALKIAGVDAKVSLVPCGENIPRKIYLNIGEKKLQNCLSIAINRDGYKTIIYSSSLGITISLIFMSSLWFIFRKSLRKNVFEPLINSMTSELEDAAKGKIATQVAHDIRSPLAALSVVTKDLEDISEEKRILVRTAVMRIQDIANNLSNLKRSENIQTGLKNDVLISSLVESIISEKRLQYRSKLGVNIVSILSDSAYGLFVNVCPSEFSRILSNLINNSVESFTIHGLVQVFISGTKEKVIIEVKDNGPGIPPEIIPQLGEAGKTFGKPTGTGLGIFHAKKHIESWGGLIRINSKLGIGTSITIELQRTKTPNWFVPSIVLEKETTVIILDDDESIHQVWANRFTTLPNKIIHITNPNDLKNLLSTGPSSPSIFFIDYEFSNTKETGLDLIEQNNIIKTSILVTSHFEENDIRTRCENLKIKLIPKNLASYVPIALLS